jgi:hypothetical protein
MEQKDESIFKGMGGIIFGYQLLQDMILQKGKIL